MLRRPCVSRSPGILNLRRLASTYPPRSPLKSLTASLNAQSLANTDAKKSKEIKKSGKQNEIYVLHPQSRKRIAIDITRVQPFSAEFALLPPEFRTLVEGRHVRNIIRQRLANEYKEEGAREQEERKPVEADPNVVKEYIAKFIRNRRVKTDEPPSPQKIAQLTQLAKRLAYQKEKSRLRVVSKRKRVREQKLTFEQQWFRRQAYGTTPLSY